MSIKEELSSIWTWIGLLGCCLVIFYVGHSMYNWWYASNTVDDVAMPIRGMSNDELKQVNDRFIKVYKRVNELTDHVDHVTQYTNKIVSIIKSQNDELKRLYKRLIDAEHEIRDLKRQLSPSPSANENDDLDDLLENLDDQ